MVKKTTKKEQHVTHVCHFRNLYYSHFKGLDSDSISHPLDRQSVKVPESESTRFTSCRQKERTPRSVPAVPGVSLSRGNIEVFTAPNLNNEAEFKLHSDWPFVCMHIIKPKIQTHKQKGHVCVQALFQTCQSTILSLKMTFLLTI